jgi:hypothetical protein
MNGTLPNRNLHPSALSSIACPTGAAPSAALLLPQLHVPHQQPGPYLPEFPSPAGHAPVALAGAPAANAVVPDAGAAAMGPHVNVRGPVGPLGGANGHLTPIMPPVQGVGQRPSGVGDHAGPTVSGHLIYTHLNGVQSPLGCGEVGYEGVGFAAVSANALTPASIFNGATPNAEPPGENANEVEALYREIIGLQRDLGVDEPHLGVPFGNEFDAWAYGHGGVGAEQEYDAVGVSSMSRGLFSPRFFFFEEENCFTCTRPEAASIVSTRMLQRLLQD